MDYEQWKQEQKKRRERRNRERFKREQKELQEQKERYEKELKERYEKKRLEKEQKERREKRRRERNRQNITYNILVMNNPGSTNSASASNRNGNRDFRMDFPQRERLKASMQYHETVFKQQRESDNVVAENHLRCSSRHNLRNYTMTRSSW